MKKTANKIHDLVDKKKEEIIALQSEKKDLEENMAHPEALEDNEFRREELVRQIECLENARRQASYTDNPDTKVVFAEMLRTQWSIVQQRIHDGDDPSWSMKAFTSLKIVASEINDDQVDDSQNKSNDQNQDDDNTGSMDPPSFDE